MVFRTRDSDFSTLKIIFFLVNNHLFGKNGKLRRHQQKVKSTTPANQAHHAVLAEVALRISRSGITD